MTGAGGRRRFPWWLYIVALLLILAVALAPVASVAIAGWIAEANGCRLDEGSIHPCLVNGEDWGPTLYSMGVMGWFMLATIPLGGLALLLLALVFVVHLIVHTRRRPA
jgi:hypothetical protein